MIEYDYTIERIDGDRVQLFKPKIETRLSRLSSIRGPNSSGKSTLLHIIAGAFYGADSDRIHGALRAKIQNLFGSTRNRLTFWVRITLPDGTELLAEKKEATSDIDRYHIVDGKKKRLSKEAFRRTFDLIYDIPHDPSDRLKELVDNFAQRHNEIRMGLTNLLGKIRHIQNVISQSKSEEELETLRQSIRNHKQELEERHTEFAVYGSDYRQLYTHVVRRRFESEDKQMTIKQKEVRAYSKKLKTVSQDMVKSSDTYHQKDEEINQFVRQLRALKEQIDLDAETISSYCGCDMPRMDDSEILNLYQAEEFQVPEHIFDYLSDLNDLLEEANNHEGDSSAESVEVLNEIKNFLEDLDRDDLALPGVDQTIGGILTAIRKQLAEKREILNFINARKKAWENIERLEKNIHQLDDILLPELKQIYEAKGSNYRQHQQNIQNVKMKEELGKEILQHQNKANELLTEYHAALQALKDSGEEENPEPKWERQNVERLVRDLEEIKSGKHKTEQEIKRLTRVIENLTRDLEMYESRESHPLVERQEEIALVARAVESLKANFDGPFQNYISKLKKKTPAEGKDEQAFYEAVYEHIGRELHTVRHLEETYKVKLANVIDEYIETEDGSRVYFADMGTGQSQSAYIASILRQHRDKTVIAMFDEISMMDSKSLSVISDQLGRLEKENQLACALVVQAGDELEVRSL